MHKCPRQENRAWNPGDEIEVDCPGCGRSMEFFQDEEKRKCRNCGEVVMNPANQKAG